MSKLGQAVEGDASAGRMIVVCLAAAWWKAQTRDDFPMLTKIHERRKNVVDPLFWFMGRGRNAVAGERSRGAAGGREVTGSSGFCVIAGVRIDYALVVPFLRLVFVVCTSPSDFVRVGRRSSDPLSNIYSTARGTFAAVGLMAGPVVFWRVCDVRASVPCHDLIREFYLPPDATKGGCVRLRL